MNERAQEFLKGLKSYNTGLYKKVSILASKVPPGSCIVELGTGSGISAILYHSVANENVEIFTIDDFDHGRMSWLDQPDNGDIEKTFIENLKKTNARVNFCKIKIEDAAQRWIRAIGLLSWDIGQPGRFQDDFNDWSKFIVLEGVAIIKDLPGNNFGTFEVIKELLASAEWKRFDYTNGVSFLRKLK